jgi:sortase (surface protein transpeptidase)
MSAHHRTRAWIGAGLLVGAAALGIAGVLADTNRQPDTSTTPATVDAAPSTIAPLAAPAISASTTTTPSAVDRTPPSTTAAAPPTLPTSPLAELVGATQSVEVSAATELPAPVRIDVAALDLSVPITPVGVQDDGELQIPDETQVGWYQLGASPGEPGTTVLAGHVNWHHRNGPFLGLRQLDPGAIVTLTLADGTLRTYQVVERQQYGKLMLPTDRIWSHTGPETLVLITCGGTFNPQVRHYRDNIVVYAVPVATASEDPRAVETSGRTPA